MIRIFGAPNQNSILGVWKTIVLFKVSSKVQNVLRIQARLVALPITHHTINLPNEINKEHHIEKYPFNYVIWSDLIRVHRRDHTMLLGLGTLVAGWAGISFFVAKELKVFTIREMAVTEDSGERNDLKFLPPILHFTYPYRLAKLSVNAIQTSSIHLKLKPNSAVRKKSPQMRVYTTSDVQKMLASVALTLFFLDSNFHCDFPSSSIMFHHRNPTISRPDMFFTVQKSKDKSKTINTKLAINPLDVSPLKI